MVTFNERVKEKRKELKLTQAQLAKLAGIPQSTVGQIENGRNKTTTKLIELAAALQTTPEYLVHGISKGDNVSTPIPLQTRLIPVISWVQAGNWSNVVDIYQPGDADKWVTTSRPHSSSTFALYVRGESMHNPGFRESFEEGDIILVDPALEWRHGSLVIARQGIGEDIEATFKKLILEDGQYFLKALNPNWENRIMPVTEDTVICGVVFEKIVQF